MTLWIAWSVVVSALIAVAAVALERCAAYLRTPRRAIWVIGMVAAASIPVALALLSTGGRANLPSSSVVLPAPTGLSSVRPSGVAPRVATSRVSISSTPSPAAAIPPVEKSPATLGIRWHEAVARIVVLAGSVDRWFATAWLLTSLALMATFVRANSQLSRRRAAWRELETAEGRVLVSPDAGPAVIGFVHPRVVIPEWGLSLAPRVKEMILQHEFEHLRAADQGALFGMSLLLIVYPWNAALWWMARRLRVAIEIDCDARVINASWSIKEYGRMLLDLGERHANGQHLPVAASLLESNLSLEARIEAMTASRRRRPRLASLPFAAVAIVALTGAVRAPRPRPLVKVWDRPAHDARQPMAALGSKPSFVHPSPTTLDAPASSIDRRTRVRPQSEPPALQPIAHRPQSSPSGCGPGVACRGADASVVATAVDQSGGVALKPLLLSHGLDAPVDSNAAILIDNRSAIAARRAADPTRNREFVAKLAPISITQGSIVGTVFDSLSAHGPLGNATVVLVERSRYATTDARGRFRFDSVPDGRYILGLMHAVLDSLDVTAPVFAVTITDGRSTTVAMATPSAATVYARTCPQVFAEVTNKTDFVGHLKLVSFCERMKVRAQSVVAGDSALLLGGRRAQTLPAVSVADTVHSMSMAVTNGFYERRAHGLGTFVTDSQISRHIYSDLSDVLAEVHGVHTERGLPYLFGTAVTYCFPNIYLDGALYMLMQTDPAMGGDRASGSVVNQKAKYGELLVSVRPEWVKGIEVYSTSGTIPAQYDLTSSTGCGSIVIWTR